ncbi:tRNA (adenine(22)-N(1))-methyltransferase TrmK [Caldibacillus lycopersici]|uniref:tRNA (Adenine(22)-N(1))-methyltransferase TrmK n=2 Tax=Perspicuibacillus lycopersici TaxID=1325689 RepID=A0AAE3LNI9_9BACI|nr:tRNA (adenine(22)-N(1))-methyltransferase TrmK [Perspicuibacillus lycopersici]MCU9613902.1 tRNA (adenine(22)-N(1))-methyltransferase TrmK [Perspicuibacillus lycopersici]
MNLSRRLTAVASYIPKSSILADIGSDHAYLPIYAVENGLAKAAIAGEVADGPFSAAKSSVTAVNLQNVIEVRKGDGLAVIHDSDQIECITIAGMGGALIASILSAGKDKLTFAKRLILQPNVAAHFVRNWLVDNDWELITEQILEEDGHIYEILVADRGEGKKPYAQMEKELFFGPFLLKEKNPIFRKKWAREKKEWERIYKQLEKAEATEAIREKKQELLRNIQWYKEELSDETTEWA